MTETQVSPCSSVRTLFPLGEVTATANILWDIPRADLFAALECHTSGSWGDVDPLQRQKNENAIRHGGIIRSIHHSRIGQRFYIETSTKSLETRVSTDKDLS